ncbi:MAG TPA: hypothetical protein PKD12_00755 [Nitrospira sp.]|nr:hypothetical protein [Nitrospira sp.]
MLKITEQQEQDSGSVALILEGRLAGCWVEELEVYCSAMALNRQRCSMIDLTGVTFIDADGKVLLSRLWRQGVPLRATGCLNRCVVAEITGMSLTDASDGIRDRAG